MCHITSCPHPEFLCVVIFGSGYLVKVDQPTNWCEIPVHPIEQVLPCAADGLLLMSDSTGVIAYGRTGQLWRTRPRNVTDDLVMDEMHAGRLYVHGYNYARGKVKAVLDIATGEMLSK